MVDKPALDSQALSLPKGGGAVQGIGESFHANLFSGTATFTIPLALSPGRNGFGPALSLVYGAGYGNGPFGLGWDLSLPRITRKTERGLPRYDDRDTFALAEADDLVPHPEPVLTATHSIRRFSPRTEGMFARIEQWTDRSTGEVFWRTTTDDGVTSSYGLDSTARLADPADHRRVYEWLLQETADAYGNTIRYEYARDDPQLYVDSDIALARSDIFEANRVATQLYLRRIRYGDLPEPLGRYAFEVVFDYGDWDLPTVTPHPAGPGDGQELFGAGHVRDDRCSSFRAGFEVRTLRRCRRVLMFHHFDELGGPTLVRSTDFTYHLDEQTSLSLLTEAHVRGYRRDADGAYASAAMPPLTFRYTEFRPHEQRYRPITAAGGALPAAALNDPGLAVADLLGDGLPGVLETAGGTFRYWANLGDGTLDRPRTLEGLPSALGLGAPGVGFGDVAGDGRLDLLVHGGPLPGFFETTTEGPWRTFRPYRTAPSFSLDDPNVRMVDLTGSGSSDVLLADPAGFRWFECLGEAGFGPPQTVARRPDTDVWFDDPGGRIRLADMTGDGLRDIVAVHNGRIEYWPNLGYGRFGARITMAGAPYLAGEVEPRRLFLADLDGSGCADLVYVDADRVHFWFNRCGNGWSERHTITGTPPVTSATALDFADVFGTGTATLVWSTAFAGQPESHYKALDFCGGTKPYVLTETGNSLGAITRITYSSSTRHYRADAAAGTPWLTRLPFPVQVVDRVEVLDEVSRTRHVTTYRYHHGCFDGREREFRGFGRVDQFDTEFVAGDQPFSVAPVETRSWFHTGLFFDPDSAAPGRPLDHRELTRRYRAEYYGGDADAAVTAEHAVDTGTAPDEAYRALRGLAVRTEVYGRDGSAKAAHPYETVEHRYRVAQLQPAQDGRRGVYLAHPLEVFTSRYERDPDDPRISHELTLEVDGFGNPRRALTVAYGRRRADPALPTPADRDRQARSYLTYQETEYTNAVDDPAGYRTPVPSQVRTYELTGFGPAGGGRYFTHAEWTRDGFARLAGATEIAAHEVADDSVEAKRLIEHVRTRYRSDDLTGLLPLGRLESLALIGESYRLALTPELVTHVFADRVDDAMLAGDGGYVHSEGDATWWTPSGRVFYSPDPADTPAEELAVARRTHFQPVRTVDPFGNTFRSGYDRYGLLVTERVDALGSRTRVRHDYRVLQPVELVDPNGNRGRVAFDLLGMVVATAAAGKPGAPVGDSVDGLVTDLDADARAAFLADPVAAAPGLLGDATTRIVYDVGRYERTGQPAYAALLSREKHVGQQAPEGVRVQISISYSDGFGREVQKKVRAEPGPVAEGGPVVADRWIGTGWATFNNKGNPVRKHEPFFDDSADFRFERRNGVSATLFYDPTQRVLGTLRPDHAWEKVVFSAWHQDQWDANDTVLIADPRDDPDLGWAFARLPVAAYRPTWFEARANGQLGPAARQAAERAAVHAGTPLRSYADALGRTVLTIAHNRFEENGAPVEEHYVSRIDVDVEGNRRRVIDPTGRTAMRYDYDLLGNPLHEASLEAGERWMLGDVMGQPIYAWNSRGFRIRTTLDELRRPVGNLVREGNGPERLAAMMVYGESVADPETHNLRGKVVAIHDESGVVRSEAYDFAGNLLSTSHQLIADHRVTPDWQAPPALSAEVFTSSTAYDALNRAVAVVTPHTGAMTPSVIEPGYNEGGMVERIAVTVRGAATPTRVIDNVDYNAKGQRIAVTYGAGVVSRFAYGADDLRLAGVRTTRPADGAVLQDLTYTYDPSGNVTHIADAAQQTVFFDNAVVSPDADFVYDAVYRLVEARGREHVGQVDQPETTWDDGSRSGLPHPQDGQAMRRYTERYTYDAVANLERLIHRAAGSGWTRRYEYAEPSLLDGSVTSNRLSSVRVGTGPVEQFSYDAHGNLLAMAHLPALDWDANDRLRRADLAGGGEAYYGYDLAGLRVRKVVERNGGALIEERLHLGAFELFRRRTAAGPVTFERESLHIMDDLQRVALIETTTVDADDPAATPAPTVRVQLGNHLGSVSLEVDEQARVLSYEEYYPFGATSYQAVSGALEAPKRYRYAGKERDEETGLAYHGARYYAPWLGRWVSSDPIGLSRGMNGYAYCAGNPVGRVDADGADWDWINPTNWCNPFSSECDVVVDDIAVGAVKSAYQMGEDTVTRTIDLWSMYSPPALLGHATGWYDISTCLSPECRKYDPERSLGDNIKGNVYDNTVGGTVELVKGVASGDPEAIGGALLAAYLGKGKGKGGGPRPTMKIPVPKLAFRPDLRGNAVATVTVAEVSIARPSLTAFAGPMLATALTGGAYGGPPSGGGSGSGSGSGSPPVKQIPEGVGKEPTRVKPPTETARPKGGRWSSTWDEMALADDGMTPRVAYPRSPLHHVIPQELLKNPKIRKLLERRGIDIDEFTVKLSEGEHSAIHTMKYNQKWANFFKRHPQASRARILDFAKRMRKWANIDPKLPYQRYE